MRIEITSGSTILYSFYNPNSNLIIRKIGGAADFCLKSKIFSLLTFGHLHTLIHEIGHAAAYRILTGGDATIYLSTASCYGFTRLQGGRSESSFENTLIYLSGPLADVIFSAALIIGIFATTHFIPLQRELHVGLRAWGGVSSVIWIFGELLYAGISSIKKDHGDFGLIARNGPGHLLFSTALLISVCAGTALGVTAFL